MHRKLNSEEKNKKETWNVEEIETEISERVREKGEHESTQ